LNIVVNTRLLIKNKLEGIGGFTFETLQRITRQHPEHTFYFIFDRPCDPSFIFNDNVKPIIAPPQARHPFLYFIWFELVISRILKKIHADIFFSPDGYLSLRSKIKQVAVFHDLNFEHYPQDLPWLERWYYRTFFPCYAHKASRIATVSQYSKSDLVKTYHLDPNKIDVVYNGANEIFQPVSEKSKQETRTQFTQGCPYFICVGSIHPRKNIVNLLKAFEIFKTAITSNIKLVIVGQKKWWTKEMQSQLNQMTNRHDVIFTGRVTQKELHHLIASANALTYVSYHEGFGIPILEAFNCNTAVITSNITSMPEVAGDAALLADPFSPDLIAMAMFSIYHDTDLVEKLIQKGREQSSHFSWQQTSDALWKCIETVINE